MASRDPGDGLDVAQAPRAFLDVRLQVVSGVVELVVAHALLEHLGFEEPPARPDPPRPGPRPHPCEQVCRPAHQPALHEVGRHGDVAPRLVHAFANRPDAVPDREPDIPQEREEALELLALAAVHGPAGEDEEIDVRARVQLSAAVAADRDEGAAGVVLESEAAPREREDVVDESRTGFDQGGDGIAAEKTRLEVGLRRRDRIANARHGSVRVARNRDRPAFPANRALVAGGMQVMHRSCVDSWSRGRRSGSLSARAALWRARAPSRDSFPLLACRAASCPGRSRGGPSPGRASSACPVRSGCSPAARPRR